MLQAANTEIFNTLVAKADRNVKIYHLIYKLSQ